MSRPYQFVDIDAAGADAVATAFSNQVAYCTAAGALITARVCAALGELVGGEDSSAFITRIRHWAGAPLADALPLRAAGGLHALHLSGKAPQMAALYAGEERADDTERMAATIAANETELLPWLDGPPQTNEAGRSANFIAAMLWLAEQGLPPRFECLEIGSSAGINLMLDRYHYDLGGVAVGPQDAAMRLAPEWHGDPLPAHPIIIASARGCDVAPVDLTDPAQALHLKAYVWPELAERFARLEVAVAEAMLQQPQIARMNAADFVEKELARPQATGTTRVLMHSIVWQYVPADQQRRVAAAMQAAGRAASPERPLAWIALEANREVHHHELVVRYWPGDGAPCTLARAHPHGAWITWGEFDPVL